MTQNKTMITCLVIVLVAVVAVPIIFIVLLATVSLNTANDTGNRAKQTSDMKAIQHAVELYYRSNQTYPASLEEISADMNFISNDPATEQPYYYERTNKGKGYKICIPDRSDGDYCITEVYWLIQLCSAVGPTQLKTWLIPAMVTKHWIFL